MKDIIAFSNSTGGKVILGIEDETCIVYGIGEQSPFKLSDACTPQIEPDITIKTMQDKTVLEIDVALGKFRPYYIANKGKETTAYIRINGTSRPADARKLQELELEGQGISYDSLQDIGRGFNQKKSFDLLTDNCNKAAKIQCALFKGIPRIISRCKEYGLQEPLLVELGDGFMVTMFRKPTNQTKQTNQSNKNEMKQEHDNAFSDLENKIIELLKVHPDVTTKGIVKTLEITDNQVKYY